MHARHCPARVPVSQRWVRHRAIPLTHLPWRLKPQQWAPFTAFGLLRLQTDPNNPADPETQAQINRTIIQVWLQPAGLMICVMPAGCLDEQHCSTDPRKPRCRMRGQLCPATLQHSGPVGWYALQGDSLPCFPARNAGVAAVRCHPVWAGLLPPRSPHQPHVVSGSSSCCNDL